LTDLSQAQVLSIVLDYTMVWNKWLAFDLELKQSENGAMLFLCVAHGRSSQFIVLFKGTKAIRTTFLSEEIDTMLVRFAGSLL
jgi:hypothetical protein